MLKIPQHFSYERKFFLILRYQTPNVGNDVIVPTLMNPVIECWFLTSRVSQVKSKIVSHKQWARRDQRKRQTTPDR